MARPPSAREEARALDRKCREILAGLDALQAVVRTWQESGFEAAERLYHEHFVVSAQPEPAKTAGPFRVITGGQPRLRRQLKGLGR